MKRKFAVFAGLFCIFVTALFPVAGRSADDPNLTSMDGGNKSPRSIFISQNSSEIERQNGTNRQSQVFLLSSASPTLVSTPNPTPQKTRIATVTRTPRPSPTLIVIIEPTDPRLMNAIFVLGTLAFIIVLLAAWLLRKRR